MTKSAQEEMGHTLLVSKLGVMDKNLVFWV
jgi:hypothetical protein